MKNLEFCNNFICLIEKKASERATDEREKYFGVFFPISVTLFLKILKKKKIK